MKVTEQIDAMRALGTDPIQKLVTPRMIATAIMLPALTVIDDFVGMVGGWLMSVILFGLPTRQYWTLSWQALVWSDDVFWGCSSPSSFSLSPFHCWAVSMACERQAAQSGKLPRHHAGDGLRRR